VALTSEVAVFQQLFQNYEKNVRPVKNASQPVKIEFQMKYLYILGVNDAEESIDINIDYTMVYLTRSDFCTWFIEFFRHGKTNICSGIRLILQIPFIPYWYSKTSSGNPILR
jgi:hypothetical protein